MLVHVLGLRREHLERRPLLPDYDVLDQLDVLPAGEAPAPAAANVEPAAAVLVLGRAAADDEARARSVPALKLELLLSERPRSRQNTWKNLVELFFVGNIAL